MSSMGRVEVSGLVQARSSAGWVGQSAFRIRHDTAGKPALTDQHKIHPR